MSSKRESTETIHISHTSCEFDVCHTVEHGPAHTQNTRTYKRYTENVQNSAMLFHSFPFSLRPSRYEISLNKKRDRAKTK